MTVLGQTVHINEATTGSLIESGQMVVISGMAVDGYYVASSVIGLTTAYVPGATKVFLTGTITEVRTDLGQLSIGDVSVDLNSLSDNVKHTVKVGDYVKLSGMQPQPDGVVLGSGLSM